MCEASCRVSLSTKEFVDSGSFVVVDLEQWTGFKSAATGGLSYCRDTNLSSVKWFIGAGMTSEEGKGTVTREVDHVSRFEEVNMYKSIGRNILK
jgi:hypothetical protein